MSATYEYAWIMPADERPQFDCRVSVEKDRLLLIRPTSEETIMFRSIGSVSLWKEQGVMAVGIRDLSSKSWGFYFLSDASAHSFKKDIEARL